MGYCDNYLLLFSTQRKGESARTPPFAFAMSGHGIVTVASQQSGLFSHDVANIWFFFTVSKIEILFRQNLNNTYILV